MMMVLLKESMYTVESTRFFSSKEITLLKKDYAVNKKGTKDKGNYQRYRSSQLDVP
jgi:hypothetical protein